MRIHSKSADRSVPDVRHGYLMSHDIFDDSRLIINLDKYARHYSAYWECSLRPPAAFQAAMDAYTQAARNLGTALLSVRFEDASKNIAAISLAEELDLALGDSDFIEFSIGTPGVKGTTIFGYDDGALRVNFSSPFTLPEVLLRYFFDTSRHDRSTEDGLRREIVALLGDYRPPMAII